MIFAELHGKLGSGYQRAHDRAEDVLTSNVFGLLRYLPLDAGLLPLLSKVRVVRGEGAGLTELDAGWLSGITRYELQLWVRHADYGEPDIILRLYDDRNTLRHLLIIEAKLYSPKGGAGAAAANAEDAEVGDDEVAPIDRDQLVRYWQLLTRELVPRAAPEAPTALLVYLTAHSAPPRTDLEESIRPGMRLGWLSWRDVWDVARAARQHLPAQDLARLLDHKGFASFTGFHGGRLVHLRGLGSGRFWRSDWFQAPSAPLPVHGSFWRNS